MKTPTQIEQKRQEMRVLKIKMHVLLNEYAFGYFDAVDRTFGWILDEDKDLAAS
jgi:hypothetical protein